MVMLFQTDKLLRFNDYLWVTLTVSEGLMRLKKDVLYIKHITSAQLYPNKYNRLNGYFTDTVRTLL